MLTCEHCGYEWEYKGKLARASCPSCGQKVKINVPSSGIGPHTYQQRHGLILNSPFNTLPPGELESEEVTTIGQDIDGVLRGLSQEEREKLRGVLVSQAIQLAQLVKLAKREDVDAE